MKKKVEIEKIYSLSPMQQGMLFHSLKDKGSSAYSEQTVFTIKGSIADSLLEESFNRIVERYDVFRTVFNYENEKQPLQILLKQRRLKVHFEDISHLSKDEVKSYVHDFRNNDRRQGFNLAKDILVRLSLFKTGKDVYTLIFNFHHILMDAWCLGIIFKELVQIYRSLSRVKPLALEPVIPYWRYIRWLSRQDKEEGLKYWREYLEGYERRVSLPGYWKRRKEKPEEDGPDEHKEWSFLIDEALSDRLQETAARNKVTLNTLFQCLWGILLQRYNNTDDAVFAAVVSGRPPDVEGVEKMVGLFINTIPVRITGRGIKNFSQLLGKTHQKESLSRSYEYLQLAEVQAQSPLKRQLIDHIMTFENYPVQKEIRELDINEEPGFKIEDMEMREQSNYDFEILVVPRSAVEIKINFNPRVYKIDFIKMIALHLNEVIKQVTDNPGVDLGEIEIISRQEKKQVLFDFNNTKKNLDRDTCYHRLFEKQVEKTPAKIAAVHNEQEITYNKLNEEANRIAYLLSGHGAKPGTVVALYMKRSISMLTSILGVFKAGCAYLPLEVDYPEERVKNILADSGAPILISGGDKPGIVQGIKDDLPLLKNISCPLHGPLEEPGNTGEKYSTGNPGIAGSPGNLAYVIYTSGTTGKPKGVMIHQLGMLNHLYAKINGLGIDSGDIIAQTASACFDISVWQFLSGLPVGGCTLIIDREVVLDTGKFLRVLQSGRVTILESVPSLIKVFLEDVEQKEAAIKGLRHLRWMIPTGEALNLQVVSEWFRHYPGIKLVNAYGPTEASDDVTHYFINRPPPGGNGTIPVGKPLQNLHIYILNKDLLLCPVGVTGEICVAGIGVGKGYWRDEKRTADVFIPNPYFKEIGDSDYAVVYKTGDTGYFREDGNVECLGRLDYQVKIRGNRIEPGEIEHRLRNHDHIKEAVVVARGDETGDKTLCAYIETEKALDAAELKEYLSGQLPGYMVPSYFIPVDTFPLTINGKIDRNALPGPEGGEAPREYAAPVNALEEKLVEIYKGVLGKHIIGTNENFFMIGGDSIKAIQVASRMNKTGYFVELADIFRHPSVSQLALAVKKRKHIREEREFAPAGLSYNELSRENLERLKSKYPLEDVYPLSPLQQGMLFHTLHGKSTSTYFNQVSYRIHGEFDISFIEKSLLELFKRHDALRTVFVYEDVDRPLQVVLEERKIDFYYEDLSGIASRREKETFIKRFREEDKRRSFDLSRDVLMRVAVFQVDMSEYEFIWSHHHILMDGWCAAVLIGEFTEIYASCLENRAYRLPEVRPFRIYIQWLEKQNKRESQRFWQEYLAGYRQASGIAGIKNRERSGNGYDKKHVGMELTREKAQGLNELAQKHSVTLNTVFQAAWGVLLAKYNGRRDVVFGLVVSGRPPQIAGVESMVGLFINTIPARIRYEEKATFKDLLHNIREEAVESLPYHYSALADIQSLNPLKQDLIDHVLVFENLPLPERIDGLMEKVKGNNKGVNLEISKAETVEQGNYDLEVIFAAREKSIVRLNYNANVYEKELLAGVLNHLDIIMEQVLNHPGIPVEEIVLLSEQERKTLLRRIREKKANPLPENKEMEPEDNADFDF